MARRVLTIRAYINNRQVRVVNTPGAFTCQRAFGQGVAGGSLLIQSPPTDPREGDTVVVYVGWNGSVTPRFTGFVRNPRRSSFPRDRWQLQLVDTLWRADQVSEDIALDPVNDWNAREAAVALLRDYAKIPESLIALPELEVSGSAWAGTSWKLWTLTPAVFTGKTVLQAVQQIYGALGYWVYADAAGFVRAVNLSGAPSGVAVHTYTEGVDLLVDGAPEAEANADTVYNQVEVTGAATGVEGAQLRDEWHTDHHILQAGVYRKYAYANDLIEYENESEAGEAATTIIAQRILKNVSRAPYVVTGRVKGDSFLSVGATLGINSTRLRNNRKYFCFGMNEGAGGPDWSINLTLDGGINDDDGYSTIPPPVASFVYRLHIEWLDGVKTYEVFLDGTSSSSPTGEVVDWAWTDGATSRSGPTTVYFYEEGDPDPTITLTVTDTTSKEGSLSITIPLAGDALHVSTSRVLQSAEGNRRAITPDGGETWNTEDGEATISCPPIGPSGGLADNPTDAAAIGLIASGGTAGETVRLTLDELATPTTLLATLPGPAHFLWHDERAPRRVYAAVGEDVHRSIDGAATWAPLGTPAEGNQVAWVQSLAPGPIEVLAGPFALWSWDQGATWATMLEGPEGSVARNYTAGQTALGDKHWVGFTGCAAGESPLRSVEGDIAVFVGADPEALDVRALTLLTNAPILIVIDAQGRIWHISAEDGSNAETFASIDPDIDTGYGEIMFAIRDGQYPVVYIWTQKAILKYFPDVHEISVFRTINYPTDSGHMGGYNGLSKPRVNIELLFGTFSHLWADPDDHGIWRHDPVTGWGLINGDLPSAVLSREWSFVRASPANPDHLLIVGLQNGASAVNAAGVYKDSSDGYSPLFISLNGGLNWLEVNMEAEGSDALIEAACWSRSGAWVVVAWNSIYTSPFDTIGGIEIHSGTDATSTKHIGGYQSIGHTTHISDGLGAEMVLYLNDRPGSGTTGGIAMWKVGEDSIVDQGGLDIFPELASAAGGDTTLPPDRQAWAVWLDSPFLSDRDPIIYSRDYRSEGLYSDQPIGVGLAGLGISATAIYAGGQGDQNLQRGVLGSGTFASTGQSFYASWGVRVARQSRTALAIYGIRTEHRPFSVHSFTVSPDDGTTWGTIAPPIVIDSAQQWGCFEVVERESET